MDQDDAIVGRIFTRREAIRAATLAGFGLAMSGFMAQVARAEAVPTTQPRLPLVASPVLTEGPFFVDEKLKRSDLLAGTTRPTVINGLPLALAFCVFKSDGKTYAPLKDAQVDVWHADAAGVYSDEDQPMNHEVTTKQTWLRGYQLTDAAGNASFNTIFPGWYQGRAPHIHFKVRQFAADGKSTAEFTSQVFFKEEDAARVYSQGIYANRGAHNTHNKNDGVYSEALADGTLAGSYMLLDLNKTATGYAAAFPIILTDANLRADHDHNHAGGPPRDRNDSAPPGGFGPPPAWDR